MPRLRKASCRKALSTWRSCRSGGILISGEIASQLDLVIGGCRSIHCSCVLSDPRSLDHVHY
jgi:hypothetical protein